MFRLEVAEALRSQGHDVVRASETGLDRADDAQILQKAIVENRILITLDEHFGDWAVLPLGLHSGVIRLKVHPTTSQNVLRVLLPFLQRHAKDQFGNRLVILSERRAKWVRTA